MKKGVPIEIGKRSVKKINELVERGLLSRDRHGVTHGLIEYLSEHEPPEYITANFDEDFLTALEKTGTITRDKSGTVWWIDILIRDLIAGKSVAEIRRARKKAVKKIQKHQECKK